MIGRTLAVGDIHGCSTQLEALLLGVVPTPSDNFVFLGDFVDRGPDSAGVISRVLTLSRSHRATALKGNHEQMMLEARTSNDKRADWLSNGGDATLRSYGGIHATLADIPSDHWKFIEEQLVDYLETDSHIFVHASAYPDMAMDEQPDYMLRWESCDTITAHESGKTIVCGHTPQKTGRPLNKGFAVCLDTNACRGGMLTCLDTVSGRIWQADADCRVRKWHVSDFFDD